jgi:DNA-binding response OmpR family regulator
MLDKEGFETETAEDGSDFLDKLDDFNPDIVTLDIMMPGLTTSEILQKLKEKKSNPKIILLTVVRYSEDEKKKIMTMGNIVDYIAKPFDIDELMTRIHKYTKE